MRPENNLRLRLFQTMKFIALERLGLFVPIPGIDQKLFSSDYSNNAISNLLNVFDNNQAPKLSVFALGIIPYINATITIQILSSAFPALKKLQSEEGEIGKKKLNKITKYLSFCFAFIESLAIVLRLQKYAFDWNLYFIVQTTLILISGAMLVMWLADNISYKGIGTGASVIIFVNIASAFAKFLLNQLFVHSIKFLDFASYFALIVFSIACIVFVQEAIRKVPIISAKQLDSTSFYSNDYFLPLRINQGGVMPIILASSLLALVDYVIRYGLSTLQAVYFINDILPFKILFLLLYSAFIIFFNYLYCSLVLNCFELSNNLKKASVVIPSIRPGKMTEKFFKDTLDNLTLFGSGFLAFIVLAPNFLEFVFHIRVFKGLAVSSLLIVVGVAIDLIKQSKTYVIAKNYENMVH
uniref:Protein translocase subunit SecY n=1 Tax=Cyanidium caldarium TaxID=2771 RepID=SECY_CYACA|nr:preprotein translocase subunit SecY [Cyanidium caldarium]P46249.2 RecName: Full=Protein translocase subunit SecY [Cyanidium caldarium]AAF12924.1 unknown [Cyanidium caldarium]WDB00295.1 preprotein translocase subunit SecY [Cyanidium caldarium]